MFGFGERNMRLNEEFIYFLLNFGAGFCVDVMNGCKLWGFLFVL